MHDAEVAAPFADRTAWGIPQILHPAAKADRPPYRYEPVAWDHYEVRLNNQRVADVRHCPEGGWSLFTAAQPSLAVAWAGNLPAMRMLVPEALPAQETARPGHYAWCVLAFHKVVVYQRPLPAAQEVAA